MASGIWPSVSGAVARSDAVDVISNNLANGDTVGFKRDIPQFKEYLATEEREKAPLDIPRGPIKVKDFYPLDGRDQSFVVTQGTYTDFKPGSFKVTQHPLDMALDGPGFFEISTPDGIRYTKQGSFKLTTDGRLVTTEGYPVLASQPGGLANAQPTPSAVQPNQGGLSTQGGVGAEPQPQTIARYISLEGIGQHVSITPQGEIFDREGNLIDRLSVVQFTQPQLLQKRGSLLFENARPEENAIAESPQTLVRQGMLENSNVNTITEMTELIKAQRLFEHDLKAIKTHDALMGKEANDIGKL